MLGIRFYFSACSGHVKSYVWLLDWRECRAQYYLVVNANISHSYSRQAVVLNETGMANWMIRCRLSVIVAFGAILTVIYKESYFDLAICSYAVVFIKSRCTFLLLFHIAIPSKKLTMANRQGLMGKSKGQLTSVTRKRQWSQNGLLDMKH